MVQLSSRFRNDGAPLAARAGRPASAHVERHWVSNGLFEAEVVHRLGPWHGFEPVEYPALEWVDWFNNRRVLAPIANIPPAKAEAGYHAALERHRMAA